MNKKARVAVITGASAGIGKAAAKSIAALGWQVIGLGRNPQRSRQALLEIRRHAPHAQVDMIVADLSIMSDVYRAAREVFQLTDSIDALLNNAGGIGKERVLTREGNEAIFAGNHLGPFFLTQELLPLLRNATHCSSTKVRVINVSSTASDGSQGFDWGDLQLLKNYVAYTAYANAKLANLMFTQALAKRVSKDGIYVYAMHPGIVASNFGTYADETMQKKLQDYSSIAVSAEEGADTLVWLATIPEISFSTASYFHRRKVITMNKLALDEVSCERLWRESGELIARCMMR